MRRLRHAQLPEPTPLLFILKDIARKRSFSARAVRVWVLFVEYCFCDFSPDDGYYGEA